MSRVSARCLSLKEMKQAHGAAPKVVEIDEKVFTFGGCFVGFLELKNGGVVEDMLIKCGGDWWRIVDAWGCVWLLKERFIKFIDI